MSATIINGTQVANNIKQELSRQVAASNIHPGLAVILVGDDPASQVYVRNKQKACQEIGIKSFSHQFPSDVSQEVLLKEIARLNEDPQVHGILVQLPLPNHLAVDELTEAISVEKDVDCFHPVNFGRMALSRGRLLPCTPAGVIELIKQSDIEISGKKCVLVGRSNIVGKPLALMMLHEGATVTVCHSKTAALASECRMADILVTAVGQANLITADMVKPQAVVVDVGINRDEHGRLVGDVDFEAVKEVAGAITPVPGGVGPMTIAMLMRNVLAAAGM